MPFGTINRVAEQDKLGEAQQDGPPANWEWHFAPYGLRSGIDFRSCRRVFRLHVRAMGWATHP
jgi:hypothetical protein